MSFGEMYCPTPLWSVSESDIPQVLQFSDIYSLPFGRGKRFGSTLELRCRYAAGRLQPNGIWRFDDALPIQLTLNAGQSLPHTSRIRRSPVVPAPIEWATPARTLEDARSWNGNDGFIDLQADPAQQEQCAQFAASNARVTTTTFGKATAQANTPVETLRLMCVGLARGCGLHAFSQQ